MDTFIRLVFGLGYVFTGMGLWAYFLGRNNKLYVAFDEGEQSGGTGKVLGVYHKKQQAEARLFRLIQTRGYGSYTDKVVECTVGKDILDEDESPEKSQ